VLLNRRPFRNAIPSGPSKSGDMNSTLPLPDEFAEVGLSFFDRHSDCHPLCFPVYADSAGDTRHKRDAPYSTAAKDPGQLEMLSAKPISRLVSSCPSTGSGNSPANRGLSGSGLIAPGQQANLREIAGLAAGLRSESSDIAAESARGPGSVVSFTDCRAAHRFRKFFHR
jgi:hypothetical protein